MTPDIEKISSQASAFFAARPAIHAGYLFGSALGDGPCNDLDFAILCENSFADSKGAFQQVLRWGTELEAAISPRKAVDLRLLTDAPVHFRMEVISTGRVVFERDRDTRVLFEARVMSEYGDYEYTRRFYNDYLFSNLEHDA